MNPARGEAALTVAGERLTLRPSFSALVAAEEELGPLFQLAERAAAGQLRLAEMTSLFWHCVEARPDGLTRETLPLSRGRTDGGRRDTADHRGGPPARDCRRFAPGQHHHH